MSDLVLETDVLSAEDARAITTRIRQSLAVAWAQIVKAYNGRAWVALGYQTWDEYCTEEFGAERIRLPREERQEVIGSLRDAGLSLRAIASATGVSPNTARAAIQAGVQFCTPDPAANEARLQELDRPTPVTGRDGKTYQPTQQRKESEMPATLDKTRGAVELRVATAKDLAAQGYTSPQIAARIGVAEKSMHEFRARHGIEVPADKTVANTRRIDSNRVVDGTVMSLVGIDSGLDLIDYEALDSDLFDGWLSVLKEARKSLTTLINNLEKEKSNRDSD